MLRNAAAPRAFAYRIRMSHGLWARSTGTGRIDVLTSTGARLLSLAPPFMVDSSRDRGSWQRVATHLDQTAGGVRLELRLNRRWLAARKRVYPVTVDPTVNLSPSPDCTIANGSLANTNFCANTNSATLTSW